MGTRPLLVISSILLGSVGLVLCFAPDEMMRHSGRPGDPVLSVMVQTTGGLALGMALLNWMSKGMLVGGVYARPLVMGNLLAFTVAALALVKSLLHGDLPIQSWALAVPLLLLAALFGRLLFVPPSRGTDV